MVNKHIDELQADFNIAQILDHAVDKILVLREDCRVYSDAHTQYTNMLITLGRMSDRALDEARREIFDRETEKEGEGVKLRIKLYKNYVWTLSKKLSKDDIGAHDK